MKGTTPAVGAALLLEQLSAAWKTQVIYTAVEIGLPDLLTSPSSLAELAARSDADAPSLRRLLRGLEHLGIVRRLDGDRFGLTETGNLLRSGAPNGFSSWVRWWGRSLWPTWGDLAYSVRTGRSARARQTGTTGFDHLAADSEAADVFYRATVELSRLTGPRILDLYDFSGFGTVVDIGGGYGELLAQILTAHPGCRGVLFELPAALEGARQHLAGAGVIQRCELVAGDFFSSLPGGADAYILKSVLHDWTEEDARRLLRACKAAIASPARLIVIDHLLIDEATSPGEGFIVSDLSMLLAHGAGERTLGEMTAILQDSGFAIRRLVPIIGQLHLIEAFPTPVAPEPSPKLDA